MKYGHEDKKTGLGLNKELEVSPYVNVPDRTIYKVTYGGEIILVEEDPKVLAAQIYAMTDRLHTLYRHLMRLGSKRPTPDEPSGDMD